MHAYAAIRVIAVTDTSLPIRLPATPRATANRIYQPPIPAAPVIHTTVAVYASWPLTRYYIIAGMTLIYYMAT